MNSFESSRPRTNPATGLRRVTHGSGSDYTNDSFCEAKIRQPIANRTYIIHTNTSNTHNVSEQMQSIAKSTNSGLLDIIAFKVVYDSS